MFVSRYKSKEAYDVVVVGGGLSGMCAAIASARGGARTAIIQNRSMYGGNASSEIRMHINGAACFGSKENFRETGILEELLLENKKRNLYSSFPVFDTIMWEQVYQQENLTSYLNTNADDVIMKEGRIEAVVCHQNSTETEYTLYGKIFVDATGHGTLGAMAGAESREGSESRYEFNEPTAPEEANDYTCGNTIMFTAVNRGEPVEFIKPDWAYTYTEKELKYRPHFSGVGRITDGGDISYDNKGEGLPEPSSLDAGYWWIELGGDWEDIIREGENIRDELLKSVYGVWDHLKNVKEHGLDNYDLEWIGMVPGSRESRRLVGDYILNENDIRSNRIFDDAVAYGGWPMDIHVPGGIRALDKMPSKVFHFPGIYSIPYRCYYSKNIDNLMMAGRDISASKMAFGSIRIMGTCAVGGQAVGTAAALAIHYSCTPRQVGQEHIKELQQQLLKDDCFIPGIQNEDSSDVARGAVVTATGCIQGGEAEQVINGVARTVSGKTNCWISGPMTDKGEVLKLQLLKTIPVHQVRITFDSNLTREIMPSITESVREAQVKGMPLELVKDYRLTLLRGGEVIQEKQISNNRRRLVVHSFENTECDEVQLTILSTYGSLEARVFEVRIY